MSQQNGKVEYVCLTWGKQHRVHMVSSGNCYRFASPADPFQMFRDSMEVRWILDRVSQSVDASKTSGD